MQWTVARIPVRIELSFVATAILVGIGADLVMSALWCLVTFVSVLVHELGHALVGRAFGLQPSIQLHGLGGTTSFRGENPKAAWKRVLISLAGPFAGFLLGGAVFALTMAAGESLPSYGPYVLAASSMFLWINLGWGVVNLLPVLPLDGGHVMSEIAFKLFGARARRGVHVFSVLVIVAAGTWALLHGWVGAAVIALMVLGHNLMALRIIPKRDAPSSEPAHEVIAVPSIEQIDTARVQGDPTRAVELAKARMAAMRAPTERGESALALARAYLASGQPQRARVVLDTMVPEGMHDPALSSEITTALDAHITH